jgi:hypothetical protein
VPTLKWIQPFQFSNADSMISELREKTQIPREPREMAISHVLLVPEFVRASHAS